MAILFGWPHRDLPTYERVASQCDYLIYLHARTVRLLCVAPARRGVPGLVCGLCPSARWFPLALLPPVDYPSGVGLAWSLFIPQTRDVVLPTGDLHPIYNAFMLGARKAMHRTSYRWPMTADLGIAEE